MEHDSSHFEAGLGPEPVSPESFDSDFLGQIIALTDHLENLRAMSDER